VKVKASGRGRELTVCEGFGSVRNARCGGGQLKRLWKAAPANRHDGVSSEELLMKLGAARARAQAAGVWGPEIEVGQGAPSSAWRSIARKNC